jgi:DNA-binding NarL/FixJ family response regulator
MSELRIALAGGAPLLQAGIEAVLLTDDRLRLVARVPDIAQAGDLLREPVCDVLVLNTESPRADAAALLAELESPADAARVVVLTHDDSRQELLATLRTGVRGYGIHSSLQPEDIRSGLLTVGRGFRWLCPQAIGHVLQQVAAEDGATAAGAGAGTGAGAGPLSPREAAVLGLAAEGQGEEQIAQTLCLSRNTVKTYLRRIREKLQATSRGEAVRLGYERGLIPLPEASASAIAAGLLLRHQNGVGHHNGVA